MTFHDMQLMQWLLIDCLKISNKISFTDWVNSLNNIFTNMLMKNRNTHIKLKYGKYANTLYMSFRTILDIQAKNMYQVFVKCDYTKIKENVVCSTHCC